MKDDKRLKRKVRNSYIVSTVSITLVLFLLGSVGYLMVAALKVADTLQESIAVSVELKNAVGRIAGVDRVSYPAQMAERLHATVNKIRLVLLMFGGALLVISLILLSNTIRLAIFSKRYLINTM